MTAALGGVDWAVDRIVSVTDGDTLRLIRRRTLIVADGLGCDVYDTNPRGVPIRLITLDSPERVDPGYDQARDDVWWWLASVKDTGDQLRIETWPGGGFDRLLGDLYVAGDRSDTLSRHMIDERGWLPWTHK